MQQKAHTAGYISLMGLSVSLFSDSLGVNGVDILPKT